MMLIVLLAAVTTLCDGSPRLSIPGDNSHYVEGKSRYIWMPDGKGVPQLVDLKQPVQLSALRSSDYGANNQYWLYTRQNPDTAQILVNGNASSVENSNYDGDKPLHVIAHGWRNDGSADVNVLITPALLEVQDCNVIVVDWHKLASKFYTTSTAGVPSVGVGLGKFIEWLITTAGGDWNRVHLIGHSLGAHVVGNAGRAVGGRIARITGLDAAGPLWGGNANALQKNDSQYVENINTDGGMLGIFDPIADANFYPNGGRNPQPGCWISTCSHTRSYQLFASSVVNDHFDGKECDSINQVSKPAKCTGSTLKMGNADISKRGSGVYGLTTGKKSPY